MEKEGNDLYDGVGSSHTGKVETTSDTTDNVVKDVILEEVDSVAPVVNDNLSGHASSSGQDENGEETNQFPGPSQPSHLSVESEDTLELSFTNVPLTEFDFPPNVEVQHDLHNSIPVPDRDSNYDEYSPVDSPENPQPNVSPELLHLVDSAIMGKPESLEKLKNIVSGVESFGDDDGSVAYLVVDSLLSTMGGVESFEEDDDNPPSVMLNSRAAIVAGELIPWLPDTGDFGGVMSPRTRMVRGLLAILRACTRNRAMCTAAGLLGVLLRSAERIFVHDVDPKEKMIWDGTPLCYCIQYLAGHSLSPSDLHQWLQVVNRTLTTVWAARLLNSLEKAMVGKETRGPASTFEFDGESSGLMAPADNRWPFTNGYAFATWIYIESFVDNISTATTAAAIAMAAAATAGKASPMSTAAAASALACEGTEQMPRLFSFLSADSQGMEAYFHAQFLVVECGIGKGKKTSVHFTHAFKPQCWYFVGIEHICKQGGLAKSESEVRLYVDGSLYESRPFDFPRISKPLAFCCIGSNPPPAMVGSNRRRRQCPLFAEMGPVYIFREFIGPERMARLACRGGDMIPSFGICTGYPWLTTNDHVQNMAQNSALDAETSLHLLYHPKFLSGRYCPDASPSGAAGMLRRPAEILGQVHVATRMRPTEALWALSHGGSISLLPLVVGNVHENTLEPKQDDLSLSSATTALAVPIFRIISLAIKHPGNNEELCRRKGPEVLSRILNYLFQTLSSLDITKRDGVGNEDLVAAIVSLCQSQKFNHALKVQLFSTLLLDLKIWSFCSYGVQKKLFSSLADMVFTESSVMRDANAIQMLLDGCRRCYWTIRESDSVNIFSMNGDARLGGEVNALVDELLVVIELLVVAAPPSLSVDDIRCLLGFMIDCPQPNQVSRVLHLIHRLVVQPNKPRAQTFAEAFISSGGIETLLVLLQREAKAGDYDHPEFSTQCKEAISFDITDTDSKSIGHDNVESTVETKFSLRDNASRVKNIGGRRASNIERMSSFSANHYFKNLGGISSSISAENARNNVYNVDRSDAIVVGIINLLGALVISGHLKFDTPAPPDVTSNPLSLLEGGGTMFDDKVSLLLFGLQKAFQAAPNRLMTTGAYTALLAASVNASSLDDGVSFYDSGHHIENFQLLLVLLRSLPYASTALQSQALQDLLILACSNPENRSRLTKMNEWPEWILEILISNYETSGSKTTDSSSLEDVEDFIHNFLIIMLEYSMRQKDGWKDIEATIHCAEWLSMIGGSSTGEQRIRREESLPIFKRRLLIDLLDFSARELQSQTQLIAAAAAGAAAEGLPPNDAKREAENAAQLSVILVENAIVILMLVEDHLRLQSKLYSASCLPTTSVSPLSSILSVGNHSSTRARGGTLDPVPERSSSTDSGGLSLNVLASMADDNGQISAAVMERMTAAAAAEPYQSVSCAFVSYGSCVQDLAQGWKYRSLLWYGVGLPPKTDAFGGGGTGRESWRSVLEKDASGNWIELPLVNKSVEMLEALLLDESGLGGGLGVGGESSTGRGAMSALFQLLDSDQPFLCMLRMALVSLREDDDGEECKSTQHGVVEGGPTKDFLRQTTRTGSFKTITRTSSRTSRLSLLWSVLSPILNMPISVSRRQRILVASCVLYSEVWHAIGKDRSPLRKQYLEAIVPPFVAVLRRWRPLLSGIHELATADGKNPLAYDDQALAGDALPIEAALAMIAPGWAASFASPPAAMGLAMLAAGTGGGEATAPPPPPTTHLRRDSSLLQRKPPKLHTFSSFQKPLESPSKSPAFPKDKAAAKAAALAAARDLERNAKIGSGRGLSAVAMATSSQRRNKSDMERVKRWNVSEAMGTAWMECLRSVDSKSVYGKDFNALSYKYIAVLVGSLASARNMQRSEVDRRTQVDLIAQNRLYTGIREWRKLIHYLVETKCFFGPFGDELCNPQHVFLKLDFMESSSRMRRILRRNYQGSDHMEQKHDKYKDVTPLEASILVAEAISTEVRNEEDEHDASYLNRIPNGEIQTVTRDPPLANDQDSAPIPSSVAPGYVPNDHDERIVLELPSSMVRPLKVLSGTFQITTRRINFIVDNTESGSKSGDDLPEKDQGWMLSSLRQVYSRRYLLRRSALELFMIDRSNYFFDFGSIEGRKNAYRAIVQVRPPNLNNIYLATQLIFVSQRPEQLLKRFQLMERWARWEISNFEYLMHLNTLAGRSYNDITQYPVFPWILSDYSSKSLDLSNPSSYRDLSKPVGALNAERLKKFQEKYSSVDDSSIPKCHYDSHYSTAGTVLYYLTRVEPFTTLSIQLQGSKFNHADRMFSDIAATWNGVLEDMNDVKELVPEMFYLPEALMTKNFLGEKLDSVRLPPWAENPVDFIHKHRMALESEHVSAHLHEWIDLIFGYKQRGKEAIHANNVFFYISYEGTVDIDKISDPVQQRIAQDRVAYVGQTPSQLLSVPHMKRMPLKDVHNMQTIFRNPKGLKPYIIPCPERSNLPASAIHASSDSVLIVDMNAPAARVAQHKWQSNTPDGQGTPFVFEHAKPDVNADGGSFMRMFKAPTGPGPEEWDFPQAQAFPAPEMQKSGIVSITFDKEIITGGHADNSVRLISADGAKTLEVAIGHCAPVTCLAISPDNNYLLTGSRDSTLILWTLNRSPVSRSSFSQDPSTNPSTSENSKGRRITGPTHVLRGHFGEITCCDISSDIGIIASCSKSSDILLHSIRRGRLVKRLISVEAHSLRLSSDGIIIAWNKNVCTISSFTLNGDLIAKKQLPVSSSICCMEVSVDGNSALVGLNPSREHDGGTMSDDDGFNERDRLDLPLPSICFFDLHSLEVFHTVRLAQDQDITAIALTKDNTNLLVSTANKQLIVFANPALSVKSGREGEGLTALVQ